MHTESIEAVVYYRHTAQEIAELEAASIPLHDAIRAVASHAERMHLKRICGCKYFKAEQVRAVCTMLLRATKYARTHLDDYFPWMQTELIASAERLEEVVKTYSADFDAMRQSASPTV